MSNIINVEIKARCSFPEKIHAKLLALGADFKGEDHQIDTYFQTEKGRLKLRKGNIENSLIFYERENKAGHRESKIILERLESDNNLRDLLMASNGLKVEVDKLRKIYFIENVKFHVDEVKGLGSFMEIEAIDETGTIGKDQLNTQCEHYIKELEIDSGDFVSVSYSDLLLENTK